MLGGITMTKLGKMGRWGNMLFQYMFLKAYGKQHDRQVYVPAWVGQEIYGFQDPLPPPRANQWSKVVEKGTHVIDDTIIPHLDKPAIDTDFIGWFQYHLSFYSPHKIYLQGLFWQPVVPLIQALQPIVVKLREGVEQVIGIHIRRGDYGQSMFYISPVDWYVAQLQSMALYHPTIFVATESREALEELKAKYPDANYHTAASLGAPLRDTPRPLYNYLPGDRNSKDPAVLDFFNDWYLLQQACDTILMPNSTFSFTAAMLSLRQPKLYRSDPAVQGFTLIDPWDSMPMQFVKQEDYAHIPGLYLDTNPYWR